MNIKFNDLGKQWDVIKNDVQPKLDAFFKKGYYIGGPEIEGFEKDFANYTRTKYAIGCSNGTDGLKLAIQCLELKGSTLVIMPANTYIADIYAVKYQHGNFQVALVDHDDYFQMDTQQLENVLIHAKNQNFTNIVIMPVHLYGHPSDMKKIMELANLYKCYVIEDASQAHGAKTSEGKMVGQYGDLCVYSLYPGKNLGAIGDAGVITTNNEVLYNRLLPLRNLGSVKKYEHIVDGWNNRMDSLQAIILQEKLKYLDEWNCLRSEVAKMYDKYLSSISQVKLPKIAPYAGNHVYHIYCIKVDFRDKLIKHLNDHGIPTVIHYPIPISWSECNRGFRYFYNSSFSNTIMNRGNILSLPMHPFMSEMEVKYIVDKIREFYTLENHHNS